MSTQFELIDISQPIDERSAVFPGDVVFSREMTVTHAGSGVMNLSALTMSPHVGTHADAPHHLMDGEMAGDMSLAPYLGSARVIDVSPCHGAVTMEMLAGKISPGGPKRLLFRTRQTVRYDVFEDDYAWISPDLVDFLAAMGVVLIGLDTPSVDPVDSKTLDTHHRLMSAGMRWLENLDLTEAAEGDYMLVALPLKFKTLEASPVRAVLLKNS